MAELAQEHKIRPSVLHRWRNEVLAQLRGQAAERAAMAALRAQERKHRIIQAENQKLKAELVFFRNNVQPQGPAERGEIMALARSKGVRMTVLAGVLGVARSTLYRHAKPPSALQQRLEEAAKAIHKAMPGTGTLKMAEMLTEHVGEACRRDRSRSIMRKLHLHPLRVIKGCTRHAAGAKAAPNLVGQQPPQAPNQAWAGDISLVRVDGGLMFLCIVIDLYSRMFLSFRLSNTGYADLSCATMRYALSHYGTCAMVHQM